MTAIKECSTCGLSACDCPQVADRANELRRRAFELLGSSDPDAVTIRTIMQEVTAWMDELLELRYSMKEVTE